MTENLEAAKTEAYGLRVEAAHILHDLFDIPSGISHTGIQRLLDCIIGCAILETSILAAEATTPHITNQSTRIATAPAQQPDAASNESSNSGDHRHRAIA